MIGFAARTLYNIEPTIHHPRLAVHLGKGHGKNRIREHGDLWLVVHVDTNKVMLRSRNKTFKAGDEMHHDGRWIDQGVDKNFEIVEINC